MSPVSGARVVAFVAGVVVVVAAVFVVGLLSATAVPNSARSPAQLSQGLTPMPSLASAVAATSTGNVLGTSPGSAPGSAPGGVSAVPSPAPPRYEIVGYFPEWGVDQRPYRVKEVETSGSAGRLTVLDYAFAVPRPDAKGTVTCQIADPAAAYGTPYLANASVDGVADALDQPLRGHFNQLRKLKAAHPGLRIVMSIGGWTDSTWFSDAARTAASRRAFVGSCIDLYVRGNLPVAGNAGGDGVATGIFDGFDIDWEYPLAGGDTGTHHDPGDTANLTALMAEFRAQMTSLAPDALLTMAVPSSKGSADGYGIPALAGIVDWFNLMAYDFHGSWDATTAHHTNLCPVPGDPGSSADETVRLFRDSYGVAPARLVLGTAFYGNGWQGVPSAAGGLGQAATGAAKGRYDPGNQNYIDLAGLTARGYVRHWDAIAKAPWLYNPTTKTFWSYDDPESLALKMSYVRSAGLGGAMFWELSGDDPAGTLVAAIVNGLAPGAPSTYPCTTP